jgi:hypothetical protein
MTQRRLTAQLILSELDVVLAYAYVRAKRGPNGETHIARLFRTMDGGRRWSEVPLVRTFFDRVRHAGFPVWPPESVSAISPSATDFEILFRDEWVPFEPGGESLWRGLRTSSGRWRTARVRTMRYETDDSPMSVPEIELKLPGSVVAPPGALLDSVQ